MQETPVQSLDQEDPLEKEMATHANIPSWKIQWMEEPGNGWRSLAGYSSPWGRKELDTTESLHFYKEPSGSIRIETQLPSVLQVILADHLWWTEEVRLRVS